jgi:prepilin-type processing-associated H-X9-DG protein
VETTGAGSYDERTWDDTRGVARDLYGGGACYAFVDGHVRFMKLSRTVGADMGVPVEKYWAKYNQNNMWNPDR